MYLLEIPDTEIEMVFQAEFLARRICDREITRFTFKKKCVFKRAMNLQTNTSFKKPYLTAKRAFFSWSECIYMKTCKQYTAITANTAVVLNKIFPISIVFSKKSTISFIYTETTGQTLFFLVKKSHFRDLLLVFCTKKMNTAARWRARQRLKTQSIRKEKLHLKCTQ